LKRCTVYHADPMYLERIRGSVDLIRRELNCMEYHYEEIGTNVLYTVVPDRKVIGPMYGKRGQQLIQKMGEIAQDELKNYWVAGGMTVDEMVIPDTAYKIMRIPLKNGTTDGIISMIDEDLMISVDATYDHQIHQIYQLNRFRQFTQEMRKEMRLRPWNGVRIVIDQKFRRCNMESVVQTMANATIDVHDGEDVNGYYAKEFEYDSAGGKEVLCGMVWMRMVDKTVDLTVDKTVDLTVDLNQRIDS